MREKHSFLSKCKNLFFKLKNKINTFKNREKKPHPHLDRAVVIMNKYSLVFHLLLSCFLVLVIECISRRNVLSAFSFIAGHTIAYLYNSFILFASSIDNPVFPEAVGPPITITSLLDIASSTFSSILFSFKFFFYFIFRHLYNSWSSMWTSKWIC